MNNISNEIINELKLDKIVILSNVMCMNIVHSIIKLMKKYKIINILLVENYDNQLSIITHYISVIINSNEYMEILTEEQINKLNQYIKPSVIESLLLVEDLVLNDNKYIEEPKKKITCCKSILKLFGCYKDELKIALI